MRPEIFILIYGLAGFSSGFVLLYYLFKPWADDQKRRWKELEIRQQKINERKAKLKKITK